MRLNTESMLAEDRVERTSRVVPVIVAVAVVAAAVVFLLLSLKRWNDVAFPTFDIGVFSQGTWLITQGEWPFLVTIRGVPLFAEHSSYVLILLAPLYAVFPSPVTLMVVHVIALTATVALVYALARRVGASPWLAVFAAGLLLFHPATHWYVWDSFHPEVLVMPLVVGAVLLVVRGQPLLAIVATVIALTAKEDVALLVIPIGLCIAWILKDKRVGFTMVGAGLVAFIVNFALLLPAWSPSGEHLLGFRYEWLGEGVGGIIVGLLTRPEVWVEVFTDPARIVYVVILVAGLPLALLAPRWLLAGVLVLAENLFAQFTWNYDIRVHYTGYLLVVLSIAAAFGAARLTRSESLRSRRPMIVGTMVVVAVAMVIAVPRPGWFSGEPNYASAIPILDIVPDDAAVAVTDFVGTRFTERSIVYLLPNPYEERAYGAPGDYGAGGSDIPDPSEVEFIILRPTDVGGRYAPARTEAESDAFMLVAEADGVEIYQRVAGAP